MWIQLFHCSSWERTDEITVNLNHVLKSIGIGAHNCLPFFSFFVFSKQNPFLALVRFIYSAHLHSSLIYWLINILDLTIQSMRVVKNHNPFQLFYFNFFCLSEFCRTDLGGFLKIRAEDAQNSITVWVILSCFVFSSRICIWAYSRAMIMRRKISNHPKSTLSTRNANLTGLNCGYTCKRNKWPPKPKPWH